MIMFLWFFSLVFIFFDASSLFACVQGYDLTCFFHSSTMSCHWFPGFAAFTLCFLMLGLSYLGLLLGFFQYFFQSKIPKKNKVIKVFFASYKGFDNLLPDFFRFVLTPKSPGSSLGLTSLLRLQRLCRTMPSSIQAAAAPTFAEIFGAEKAVGTALMDDFREFFTNRLEEGGIFCWIFLGKFFTNQLHQERDFGEIFVGGEGFWLKERVLVGSLFGVCFVC